MQGRTENMKIHNLRDQEMFFWGQYLSMAPCELPQESESWAVSWPFLTQENMSSLLEVSSMICALKNPKECVVLEQERKFG